MKTRSRLAAILLTAADVIIALAWLAAFALPFLLFGCAAMPQTPAQWRKELRDRAAFARVGLEYKGPHALKAEAEEMRAAAANVTFSP